MTSATRREAAKVRQAGSPANSVQCVSRAIYGAAITGLVEILSKTNTQAEMEAKLQRYFEAGVQLAWYVDPSTRSATVYHGTNQATEIRSTGRLEGGTVLPEFYIELPWLFDRADRQTPQKR
ncbi:MAG: Uma2 family endonuclease [Planctomycetales bacterium]|nr:Uma2 family endonuclease [Planctomycetales bacterium]